MSDEQNKSRPPNNGRRGATELTLTDVMRGIYECEENCSLSVSSDWHGGWRVTIGGSRYMSFESEVWVDDPLQAAQWLHKQAIRRYPSYKLRYGRCTVVSRPIQHHGQQ
jgi:hypothetical protein